MSLAATYGAGKFGLSFELYPPKTRQGEAALFRHVEELVACQPSFITCTYGAGGSTRTQTLEIIGQVKNQFQLAGRVALDLCRFDGRSAARLPDAGRASGRRLHRRTAR